MRHHWQKDYPAMPNLSEAELGENNSLVKTAQLVGENRKVIDFGCATGYLARLLNARGCQVTGLEINADAAKIAEQYCERVIVADLDYTTLLEILPNEKFDVAIFGDVLEHLRNPWDVLREVRNILTENGFVVASIPNVAHGAVRLALLSGKFQYEPLGLLDNTHLRFFTYETVVELFEESGYTVDEVRRTIIPVFEGSNLVPKVNRNDFPSELVQAIEQEEDANTLQFVLKAFPLTPQGEHLALQSRYYRLLDQHKHLQDELKQAKRDLDAKQAELVQVHQSQIEQSQTQIEQLHEQVEQSQTQIEQLHEQVEQLHEQVEQTKQQYKSVQQELERTQTALEEARSHAEHIQIELHHAQSQLDQKQKRIQSLRKGLETREIEVLRAQDRISAMETSKFWQFRMNWFRFKKVLRLGAEDISPFKVTQNLPKLSQARVQPQEIKPVPVKSAVAELSVAPVLTPYERWMQKHTPQAEELKRMKQIASVLAYKPLISIVVPVYNTPEEFLREAIESVIAQLYPHWELCLADDASPDPHVKDVLKEYAEKDDRIKVVFREENGHISRCSNSALELATGEYIALLDHDDTLAPEALFEVAFLLNQHPEADMVYSDEDKIDEQGNRRDPYFKPDWSPDTFLGRMYTCHLGVYRRSIISEIGGFRAGYEGSQDYDLVLRFTEKTNKVFHIAKILYHWRIHEQSAASGTEAKPYAYIAAKKALTEALQRRGEPGTIEDVPDYLGHFSVRYEVKQPGLVSIIIPTKDLGYVLNQCLESIFTKTTYPNFEVVLINNGSTEPYTEKVIGEWLNREPGRLRCYMLGIPFNYSKLNNYGVSKANGEYFLFLNNDTEVITPDWLEIMVGQAQRSSIGAVGAFLLYPDNTVQHAGVIVGLAAFAGHPFTRYPANSPGYFGLLLSDNNYSAVTGACLMCKREVFESVGGFNEDLAVAFNDVDLCLRFMMQGYRNVCCAQAELYHYESKSRGSEDLPEKKARFLKECEYMKQKWQEFYEHDPCYNPHLTRQHCDYRIREMQ
ncbi:glycosyltransferase [Leptolyngbya sp. FACHB-711]|uniref:glycosyltransferase n=1 Tax=unclassified Leptolyngbya TaxID=2650499 RepID=UPI001684F3E1|nr:glycosyltransferase [Leptolyngbya sp. FACHB-711]MBD2024950.1 glycosyltransferase [Leptolyngbya sp. FACHB-711]